MPFCVRRTCLFCDVDRVLRQGLHALESGEEHAPVICWFNVTLDVCHIQVKIEQQLLQGVRQVMFGQKCPQANFLFVRSLVFQRSSNKRVVCK